MIIDEIVLGGEAAYLKAAADRVTIETGETGVSRDVGEGEAVDIDGLDLFLVVKDARKLFSRSDDALFRIEVKKELFPNLYLDPYEHRVVQLSGFEDLRRLAETDMVLMEIDGVATLVSPGDRVKCRWRSARYPLPTVAEVAAAAWDLAASTLTPADNFAYDLTLHYWQPGQEDLAEGAAQSVVLTQQRSNPRAARHKTFSAPLKMVGHRFEFEAEVQFNARLAERHGKIDGDRSLGTPLLQALYLLERTPRTHQYHSLQEMIAGASSYQLLDPEPPLSLMTVSLQLEATLTEGETIALEVMSDEIERVEARLNGMVRRRPMPPAL